MRYHNPRLDQGFGQVSNVAMRDPELSLNEKALYAYLSTYVNNNTNETNVSVSRMVNECNVSERTIKRSLKVLEEKGYISRQLLTYGKSRTTVLLK